MLTEVTSSTMALAQFNVNFFGQINVTHAVLPYMRERRSGLVIFFGSRSVWKPDAVVRDGRHFVCSGSEN